MRIVIDMQGAQGVNRQRGIGRYTLAIAQAIARNRGEHEIILALNGLFPDTIEPIRAIFNDLLPQENIRVWHSPGPVAHIDANNDWRRKTAELVREAFLASLEPDMVLISSLFEGLGDDAVTNIATLSHTVPTASILYDLIPLIHRQPYLKNQAVEAWYENKLSHLRRADLLLAISDSSRNEGLRHLGFSTQACVSISTATDPQFQPRRIDSKMESDIRGRYGLLRPFVMYTGGIDHRKNIEGLIRAYVGLPEALRVQHQLAVICSIQPQDRERLKALAKAHKLKSDELVLTGFVPEDDLVALYNLCKLFVFPSWHEGFGLPALEAMTCGRAVIGSNTSSIPEVIGREDALFDPYSDQAIAAKMAQVLTNDAFRSELERHGLKQAKRFSWDISAQRAIAAIEAWHAEKAASVSLICKPARRPKLAYISPLPPARSGISDYSAELLPELSRHYDIEVVVALESVSAPWVKANCPVRSVDWFRVHAQRFDRVLYHFGNSHFHQHMFSLLEDVPGIMVLHDFFLSGIVAHWDVHGFAPGSWAHKLYHGHGYAALQHRFHAKDTADVIWAYPCNLSVLQSAQGIIVHSQASRRLARQWYGGNMGDDWAVIPLLRVPAVDANRAAARRQLKLNEDDFVVCSFGLLNPTKLNHRLLDAWLASVLAKNKQCVLVFVGENHYGDYGQQLLETIRKSGLSDRIRITGWADTSTFRHYLAAADVGVQLRTLSRGETSAAVLDCMNYGLPTIVNAHGSMADFPDEGVWKLPDAFEDAELTAALESLWREPARRKRLGTRAQEIIRTCHAPRTCGEQYAEAIEAMYRRSATNNTALSYALASVEPRPAEEQAWIVLAQGISRSISPKLAQRQLLVDISELLQRDAGSGIQRVVRSILHEWLHNPPAGYRVEPVYATTDQSGYRYARRYTLRFLNCPDNVLADEPIDFQAGDIFLGLDLQPQVVTAQRTYFQELRRQGINIKFVVYDLLCLLMPQHFFAGGEEGHHRWLQVVSESDGAICISKAVADELTEWLQNNGPQRLRSFTVDWFHLGVDVEASTPTKGLPEDSTSVLNNLQLRQTFLMVGTIEPRKGYSQTLTALESLWNRGVDANLVIVGKQGWMVEALVKKLRHHPELGKRLFWLGGISDEYLEKVYAASSCLIAASEGEGFGLPLIEAGRHKLPIIARNIPVFREVAGEHAFYFSGKKPKDLADAIVRWLSLHEAGTHPKSDTMPWLTWRESAENLKKILMEDRCESNRAPTPVHNRRQGAVIL